MTICVILSFFLILRTALFILVEFVVDGFSVWKIPQKGEKNVCDF